MCGKKVEEKTVEVIEPDNKIVVIDKENLSFENSIYNLKNKEKSLSYNLVFQDSKENDLYTCKFKSLSDKGYFKDFNEKIIVSFKLHGHFSGKYDITINKEDKDTHSVTCQLIPRNSTSSYMKYTVEFKNKETGKTEILDVQYKNNLKKCFIYYGKQKENGQLICKLLTTNLMKNDFTIEIAPNVDQLFINVIIYIILRMFQTHIIMAMPIIV